jgi:hypothetical protein
MKPTSAKQRWFISFLMASGASSLSAGALATDPTTADCLAASDASLKSGNEHKLRAERAELLICAATSCPADVRRECLRRVDEVNAAIPTVIFEAKDSAGNDLSAVALMMDGQLLAERLEGTALSIDPGEHDFVFRTAGQEPIERRFVIREGQKDRREAIVFGSAAPLASTPAPVAAAPLAAAPAPEDPSTGLGAQRTLAVVAAGVGVVGVGLGTVFGATALSKKNDAASECPTTMCTPSGLAKWNDAQSAGNASTVFFVVGGVALAGGAVLWFTAKPAASARIAAGVGPGSLQVKGVW